MKHNNIAVKLNIRRYPMNNRLALELLEKDGMPYAVATVNVPDVELEADEVIIKNYSENEGILEMLEKEGIVKQTGKSVRTGWVTVPICKLLIDLDGY